MICPDCKGWGYLATGGICYACNGDGDLPDINFPTDKDARPKSETPIEPEVEEEEEEEEEETEEDLLFHPEMDADWWKTDKTGSEDE